jgi:hypothetical protein
MAGRKGNRHTSNKLGEMTPRKSIEIISKLVCLTSHKLREIATDRQSVEIITEAAMLREILTFATDRQIVEISSKLVCLTLFKLRKISTDRQTVEINIEEVTYRQLLEIIHRIRLSNFVQAEGDLNEQRYGGKLKLRIWREDGLLAVRSRKISFWLATMKSISPHINNTAISHLLSDSFPSRQQR